MRFKFKKLRIIIFFLLLISSRLSAQKAAIILHENDSTATYKVKLSDEIAFCIKDIEKGNSDKIITLFLENINNKFDDAVGLDLYLVNKDHPDSIQFLTSETFPKANTSLGYTSKATYRIELNSYLNDTKYSTLLYSSFFILKMHLINFSNTPMRGNLVIDNIKVTCTRY